MNIAEMDLIVKTNFWAEILEILEGVPEIKRKGRNRAYSILGNFYNICMSGTMGVQPVYTH